MPRRTRNTHTHARKSIYTITRNERFSHHFLVSPDLIYESELLFVYNDDGNVVQKKVPLTFVMKHAGIKRFFGRDPETLRARYCGYVYEVPSQVIETYKG